MMLEKKASTRSFGIAMGVYALFNLLFLLLVMARPGTHMQFVVADDLEQALGWLLATIFCFVGLQLPWSKLFSRTDRADFIATAQRWVPILFALGIFCQFIGQVVYTYDDINKLTDFPSLADVAYLSTFPCLLAAILLLPARPLEKTSRSRVTLDGFIIWTALVTFSWYFVLGPTMLQGYETAFAKVVGSAYPFFDLVLIFCVLRLTLSSRDEALRPVVQLLALGLVIVVITDSIYDYQQLQGTYVNGWQDVGWPLGYMLIGLAVLRLNAIRHWQRTLGDEDGIRASAGEPSPFAWHSLLPYGLIPAVLLLMLGVWQTGANTPLERGVYLGGAILIALVVLRQFFVFRETIQKNRLLHSIQQEVSSKNQALSLANKRLEEQAKQLEAAYEREHHLNQLKDQFLLNVNHELRTPLTEIHGYLNLLSSYRGKLDQSLQDTFIDHAVHGSEELLKLVNNVLDAIRGDVHGHAPQLEELPVGAVVNEVLELFEPEKHQEHALELSIPDNLLVKADRQYLHRILLNLLSNAFKYSPEGTPIVVTATLCERAAGTEGQEAMLCVQDAGPGIPSSEISLLFGKFVRLKRDLVGSVRGTGLGLYISKQLTERMGGRMWVESTGIPGEGSRFYFTLEPVTPQ